MNDLTAQELRDLLRILTINRARLEADNPELLANSTGAHLEICERIREIKAELDGDQARQEAA